MFKQLEFSHIFITTLLLILCNISSATTSQSSPSFTAFGLNGVNGEFVGNQIILELPRSTDLTNALATFTVNYGTVTVNGVDQISGVTRNNFASPLIYQINSDGLPKKTCTVTCYGHDPVICEITCKIQR